MNCGDDFVCSSPPILPHSVEDILKKICNEQKQTPADWRARKRLFQLGEDTSLQILNSISRYAIKTTLSRYILFMANKYSSSASDATDRVHSKHSFYSSSRYTDNTDYSSRLSSPTHSTTASFPLVQTKIVDFFRIQRSSDLSHKLSQDGITTSHSPLAKRQLFSCPSSSEKPSTSTQILGLQLLDPIEVLLSEFEFRKAFLIRSYIGSGKLEGAVAANDIRRWKDIPMSDFEAEVWNNLGKRYLCKKDIFGNITCDETERLKYRDWDSGMTHIYQCHVLQDGSYVFKGPFLSTTKTHLQRTLGDENVMMVKLAGETSSSTDKISYSGNYSAAFNRIAEEGIIVGLRRYRFFVFKDGGKEEKRKDPTSSSVKCFFVRMESLAPVDVLEDYPLTNKTLWESRCLFMHAHMVSTMAKYMARFSLILSKTIKLQVDLSSVCILVEDDLPCRDANGCIVYNEDKEPLIHTDGTGFISEDLALQCPKDFSNAKYISDENFEKFLNFNLEKLLGRRESDSHRKESPLLMQIRLFYKGSAVKGTLLVNKQLPPRTIVIRPSMLKVQMDSRLSDVPTFDSLEIVGISKKPRKTFMSKNLIALLTYGGVPKEFFLNIMESALKDAQTICTTKRAALRAAINYGEMDDYVVARMILCGIPLDEPYLQSRLSVFANQERNGLKGIKLPISDSFYLMGTTDPTGKLERNQVCVIIENGQVSGPVLVYRNPGLHFGDIHILEAIYVKEIENFVGNAQYGIFFSTKGRRSVGSEFANGDFDGDVYWVSRNSQLLSSFNPSEPWMRIYSTPSKFSKKPSELPAEELEHELFRMFLRTRFQRSTCMGVAADSWIAHIDRLLMLGESCANEMNQIKKSMHQLVDLYYDALDAPKSGKQVMLPEQLISRKFPHYMKRERNYKSSSVLGLLYDMAESYQSADRAAGEDIWKLPCFNVEIPPHCMELWRERYNKYRPEMFAALKSPGKEKRPKDAAGDGVIQRYKQLLYDAVEFEDSPRLTIDIFNEAIAIYHVSYNKAIQMGDPKCCMFAWKVAGPALCKLYSDRSEQNRKQIICSPSVLREVI